MKLNKAKSAAASAQSKYYRLAETLATTPGELWRADAKVTRRKQQRHGQSSPEWRSYQGELAKYCLANRKDVAKIYENPLDDDDMLERIRREVFGSAP